MVADTHVGDALPSLPPGVVEALRGVDLIVHAGDISIAGVLEELRGLAPVVAVRGNHDDALGLLLPEDRVVRVGDVRIGVSHGRRNRVAELLCILAGIAVARPVTIGLHRALLRRVGPVDCLVFGHFHMPVARRVRGALVFSPGAVYVPEADPAYRPRGPRGRAFLRFRRGLPPSAHRPSVGILEVSGTRIDATVVPVEGPLRVHRGAA